MNAVVFEFALAPVLFAGNGVFFLGSRAVLSTRRPRLIRRRTTRWPNVREAIRFARGIE
jgi:hypothetical protein